MWVFLMADMHNRSPSNDSGYPNSHLSLVHSGTTGNQIAGQLYTDYFLKL